MNKIDEFVGHFHSLNLKYDERVKGFDPSGIFVEHLPAIGFNNSFINTIPNEDRDNYSSTHARDTNDLETILNTNESYKQKGKGHGEKSAQSPTATPKSTTSRSSAPTTHQIKKVTHTSFGRGGDKNSPSGKIESSHKICLRKKKKSLCKKRRDLEMKVKSATSPLRIWNLILTSKKCFPTLISQRTRLTIIL
jgi:hypothetical protein